MAESQHILSIEVDIATAQAREQIENLRENAEKPINIPVTASGAGGSGGTRNPRVATGAPFPSDEGPVRGTPSQERLAREQGFSSYAEKMRVTREFAAQRIEPPTPSAPPSSPIADPTRPTPTDVVSPPATVSKKSQNITSLDELGQE